MGLFATEEFEYGMGGFVTLWLKLVPGTGGFKFPCGTEVFFLTSSVKFNNYN